MLAPSSAPWTAEHISRTMLHVFGAPDRDGYREVVCILDGPRQEANAALICIAPVMRDAILADNIIAARAALTDAGLT